MERRNGFYDLSVTYTSIPSLINLLRTLIDLGYSTVAINQVVEESALNQSHKKKVKNESHGSIPPPVNLDKIPKDIRYKLRILQRVTVHFSTSDMAHKMTSSENYKKYDIVAVIPTSKNAVNHLCSSMEVDIISADLSKMESNWSRKLYYVAVERGMWFELPYASAVLDTSSRRRLIGVGHRYHAVGKSKNIFISSGAENPMQIRGPYDVINLGLLLGLSEEQAKRAITSAGRSVILRAESRRSGKSIVFIERVITNKCNVKEEEELNKEESEPAPKKLRAAEN